MSLPKSAVNKCLLKLYKKSVETCPLIKQLVSANTIKEMNRRTNTPRCLYTLCKAQRGLYAYNHIQNRNGRIFVFILLLKFCRFRCLG